MTDRDNPAWTEADFAAARPAAEVLPGLIGAEAAAAVLSRGRGRPRKDDAKLNQTLRLDRDVVEAYRRTGRGWQVRMNAVLRANMPRG